MSEKVACPYNKEHKVKPAKLVFHIAKCKNKDSRLETLVCPYNSLHFIHHEEYNNHILIECPQKPTEEQLKKIQEINNSPNKATQTKDYKVEEEKNINREHSNKKNSTNSLRNPPFKDSLKSNTQETSNIHKTERTPVEIESKNTGHQEGFTINKLRLKGTPEDEKKKKEIEDERIRKEVEEERIRKESEEIKRKDIEEKKKKRL